MIYYILLIILVLIIGFSKNHNKSLKGIFVILFLFSAVRFNIGTDYPKYYQFTSGMIDIRENNYMLMEPFNVLLIITGYILHSPQFYFIISSLLVSIFFYFGIKQNSSDYFLSTLCFICFPFFYLESMNIVRQFIAIAIIFYAIKYIYEKNFAKYASFILIASLFHISALIAFILYINNFFDFNRQKNIFLLVLSIFLERIFHYLLQALAFLPFFSKINFYLSTNQEGYRFVFLSMIVLNIINLIFYNRINKIDEKNKFLLDSFNIGCCLIFLFMDIPVIAGRLIFYFYAFLILIIPNYYRLFKQKVFIKSLLCIILIILFFIRIWYSSHLYDIGKMPSNPYIPYKTFLQS